MRIVVAGIGVAGTFLINRLAEICSPAWSGVEIILVDHPSALGRGQAFGSDVAEASINTSQARLGSLSPSFHPYTAWRGKYSAPLVDLDTRPLPRSSYGDYLVTSLSQALDVLRRNGVRAHLLPGELTQLSLSSTGGEASVGRHHLRDIDLVVLSVGTWTTKLPEQPPGGGEYLHQPYPLAQHLLRLRRHRAVAVIGTGLTAVDVACALDGAGTTVHLISRSGRLPRVQVESAPLVGGRSALTKATVDALRDRGELTADAVGGLVDAEMARFGWGLAALADRDRLSRHWQEPLSDPMDLACHQALSLTNHSLNHAFAALPPDERDRLRSILAGDWLRYRVRIPLARWTQLRRMIGTGQVVLHSGVDARSTDLGRTVDALGATCVVNATGPSVSLAEGPAVLSRLAAQGHIAVDEAGRGISEPRTARAIRADRTPHDRLVLMGQATAGSHLIVSALDVLHRQAQVAAASVASRITKDELAGAVA